MSEIANSNSEASESEKPANDVTFPPFPDPTDADFDDDISEEERIYYKTKFEDLSTVKNYRLHCTACDRHLGCSARNERMRAHPLLRTLVCHSCHTFYNSGEFEKGDDGSELYCRWCGQGGQVYCCSDCPHVFCAKCIKRNLGSAKIKEIENADDWKCFKCDPKCLQDLRAICWAVLRYCDIKNKITHLTKDADLKAAYQKDCALDHSECCKHKTNKRNQKVNDSLLKKKDVIKKEPRDTKESKEVNAKVAAVISKMPSTIQVKKFATIPFEETSKSDKKAQKRPASPKQKSILVKNPINIASCTKSLNPTCVPALAKKIRLTNFTVNTPIRFPNVSQERKVMATYTRIRPKPPLPIPIANNCYNGLTSNAFHCNNPVNDNINLSLESLTQGIDMAAVAAMSNNSPNDDVVCTPDFPLEPLCEVTEDNDDDVQCITPGPVAAPKLSNPPPLIPRSAGTPILNNVPDVTPENIIQMTENDVTVNESTGGLKFRVDPQTLSSNKMYRLPDGRIFAINANPNMPGGYSATIVAVTEANKSTPKGATYAAKLSSVLTSTPANSKSNHQQMARFINIKRTPQILRKSKSSESSTRECDLNVPVEWYRYNLIDAVDALEYSLSRLHKLKKEATTVYLRTRSVNEMKILHKSLERLLNTSSCRFNEIRENLNKGWKQYLSKKTVVNSSDEDDDVEILPDADDGPIYIDEHSLDSNQNGSENQEVDLTGPGSSECNDSENRNDNISRDDDPLNIPENDNANGDHTSHIKIVNIKSDLDNSCKTISEIGKEDEDNNEVEINGTENTKKNTENVFLTSDDLKCDETIMEMNGIVEEPNKPDDKSTNLNDTADSKVTKQTEDDSKTKLGTDNKLEDIGNIQDANVKLADTDEIQHVNDKIQNLDDKANDSEDKLQETDISDELIESLLKDDNSQDNTTTSKVPKALQVN